MQDGFDNQNQAYRKKATIVVFLGGFLLVFHFTVINIAFPKIQTAFGADIETIKWVFNGMMLSTSILLPLAGWLGRVVGLKNLFLVGFINYIIVTILCGSAWSIESLIVYQVIQGIGAGILNSVTVAMIAIMYPAKERVKGMAYWSISTAAGGAVGPLVGGYVSDNFSWRLIYYVNTPLALIGLIVCFMFLKKDEKRSMEKFDYSGFALISIAIVCLLLALSQGRVEGWSSNYILSLITIFIVSFGAWIAVELKVEKPMVDLALFKDKYFVAGATVTFLIGISLYGTNFLLPLFLQRILSYSVFRSAVIVVIGVVISLFFSKISGPLADRFGPRVPLVVGIIFWAVFCYVFSFKDDRASFVVLGAIMIIRGVGYGLSLPPMMAGALTKVPARLMTMASGMLTLTFSLGGMFTIAVLGTMLDKRELIHYSTYASEQNLSSQMTANTLSMFQSFFNGLGYSAAYAKGFAVSVLYGMVRKEAIMSAFQDSFIFLALATLLALVPAFIMGRVKNT